MKDFIQLLLNNDSKYQVLLEYLISKLLKTGNFEIGLTNFDSGEINSVVTADQYNEEYVFRIGLRQDRQL